MTKIGLIRHGITSWNKEGRAQGSSDIPLHEEGLAEAKLLAERLSAEKWDVIYASNLLRARQTAETIKEKIRTIPLQLDSRIREVGGGLIEGTTEAERLEKWGSGWREMDLGFEPHNSVIDRGMEFIKEISAKHAGENVLVVSHGSFIRHLLRELVPHADLTHPPKNTSLTTLLIKESQWDCELYNCTNHLEKEQIK
ncbi:histidine phosphatase family protein [Bacillus sp. ISL-47]|uniref:histidine phosphatase family protein n=1 Tax=Bacillus sp. ISL-47 TaxID=2819130 RepID=UPI001BE84FE2|nr:histidine phosphatase family protein [Bacillus sp. ISL-47]MBT2690214.1 histidine phosphatase family protein [Bacillus sp. ISL-47]MBT2710337.1 histidine phosphatase family protein [Pseudomonas sp. ISL-84]